MNDFLQSLRGNHKDKRVQKTRRGFDSSSNYNSNQSYGQNQRNGNVRRNQRQQQQHSQPQQDKKVVVPAIPEELVESISMFVELFSGNQEKIVEIQERRVAAEERKAVALEEIAVSLKYLSSEALGGNAPEEFMYDNDFGDKEFGIQDLVDDEPQEMAPVVEETVVEAPVEEPVEKPAPKAKRKYVRKNKKEEKQAAPKKKVINRKKTVAKKESVSKSNKGLLPREEVMGIINKMRKEGATFDQVAKHLVDLGQPTFSGRGEWHAQTVHRLCNKKKKK